MAHDHVESSTENHKDVKTILVVEDDEDIGAFIVQAILDETPYQALLVTDGFQALKAVRNIKPNLLLIDYYLPSMDGLELFDQLHAQEELEGVPTIMMSASTNVPRQEVRKRKIFFLGKPLELSELLQTIEKLLG
jgi:DNA-binding response OmpR family regulator